MKIRVGQGYDVHRWVEGRPFILGGVEIPSDFGPLGHSDATWFVMRCAMHFWVPRICGILVIIFRTRIPCGRELPRHCC